MEKQVDEITEHVNASWYGDTNSFWRLWEFPLNEMQPSVQKLAIHLPNEQSVIYDPDKVNNEQQIREIMESLKNTTLTAFFKLNDKDEEARQYVYPDILRHYRWIESDKVAERRKTFQKRLRKSGNCNEDDEEMSNQIGRMPVIVPRGNDKQIELYYLRVLLHNVPGPRRFEDLKTVRLEDGSTKVCQTFKQACIERGLCEGDNDAREALKEAMTIQFGRTLRHFFVTMVQNDMVGNPLALWEEFKNELCEDSRDRGVDAQVTPAMINKALMEMRNMFEDYGTKMTDKGLPEVDMRFITKHEPRELQEELDRCDEAQQSDPEEKVKSMNERQKLVFEAIMASLQNEGGKLFAIDAPGGTGKLL